MGKFTLETAPRYERHYDEDKFWLKLQKFSYKWGERLLMPAMTLYCMMKSGKVALRDKAIIVGALGYLILPLDAVPDFIPMLGIVDDISAIMLVIKTYSKLNTPELRSEAKRQAAKLLGNSDN